MAIDSITDDSSQPKPSQGWGSNVKFTVIYLILALLAINEIRTLSKLSSMGSTVDSQAAQARKELTSQIDERLNAIEQSNAQMLESFKKDVELASKNAGTTRAALRKEHKMIAQLQDDQSKSSEQLKAELAQKADQQAVGALTEDVNATRADLDTTKKALDQTKNDIGMARSEFGTLIARNHDDIEQLRKLGERDYYEFALDRGKLAHVANVALTYKGGNVKRHRFNLLLVADDMQIEKKNRTVNEPIFFYVGGSKRPFELVVNNIQSKQVKGYISTPKGAVQTAANTEGTR